jgi:hypothetical protein
MGLKGERTLKDIRDGVPRKVIFCGADPACGDDNPGSSGCLPDHLFHPSEIISYGCGLNEFDPIFRKTFGYIGGVCIDELTEEEF